MKYSIRKYIARTLAFVISWTFGTLMCITSPSGHPKDHPVSYYIWCGLVFTVIIWILVYILFWVLDNWSGGGGR